MHLPIRYLCPDCDNSFDIPIETAEMLFDILDNNSALKLVCSKCGNEIEQNYALLQYIKQMQAQQTHAIFQPGR